MMHIKLPNNLSSDRSSTPWFPIVFLIVMIGIYTQEIPDKLMGGFAICVTLGTALQKIGNRIPVLKDYGGGPILAILVPSLMLHFSLLPEYVTPVCKNFFNGYDLSSMIVSSLLVGGVLSMDRKLLIHTGARFIIPMIGSLIMIPIIVGCAGVMLGYEFQESVLYISAPILGAGISALVPLAETYAKHGLGSPDVYLTTLTSAVMIANIISIVLAAIMTSIGSRHPSLFRGFSGRGEGDILRISIEGYAPHTHIDNTAEKDTAASYFDLGTGFILTLGFYVFGQLCNRAVPALDAYLFMSLTAILLKVGDFLPDSLCQAAGSWTKFVSKTFSVCAMTAISLSSPNMLSTLSDLRFVVLCVSAVLITVIVAGGLTWLFGFYFIEGSIMAGLGLSDMGGAGDIAVLGAAKRMDLMPFLTISTRIGGAINLTLMSIVASLFM